MRRAVAGGVLVLLATAAAASELVPIPDTDVWLVLPPGFRVARDFPGIGNEEDLTSILVTELPVPVSVSRARLEPDALAAQGVSVHRSGPVLVAGEEAMLIHASQRLAGMAFRKWILLLGDETASVMLTATTPLEMEEKHQAALVETLSSAEWRPQRPDVAAGALPFRIAQPAPLQVVTSSANAVVLADPSGIVGSGRVPSHITVGASEARVAFADVAAFALARLGETTSIDRIEVAAEAARSLDGLPGYELRASGRDLASERPVAVTQLIASDGDRYFLVQAIVDADEAAGWEPLYEAVVESFRLRRPDAPPAGAPEG